MTRDEFERVASRYRKLETGDLGWGGLRNDTQVDEMQSENFSELLSLVDSLYERLDAVHESEQLFIDFLCNLYNEDAYLKMDQDGRGYTLMIWETPGGNSSAHVDNLAFKELEPFLDYQMDRRIWVLNKKGQERARKMAPLKDPCWLPGVKMNVGTCRHCGKRFSHYSDPKTYDPLACRSCSYWNDKLERRKNLPWYNKIVINGYLYFTGQPGIVKGYSGALGFAGRRFRIRNLETGETIETNNLSANGDVPDFWRPKFPDNAEWVE
jgi:hypothetical protein